jgi:hypothetical protein
MRLLALAAVFLVLALPTWAQQPSSEKSAAEPPPATSTQDTQPTLPVSLEKIKGALAREPVEPLRGLNDRAHFKIEIRERQKLSIEDLIAAMDFRSGPAVPGGIYAYEQNRLAFPAVDNPMMQPYAAFSQGELLTILIQNLAVRYLGGKALNAVSSAMRSSAEQAARHEVQVAIAEYCAAQPNGGVGIQLCSISPDR